MTDARLPSRWLLTPQYASLSHEQWYMFTRGLMWSAEVESDGAIPTAVLSLLCPSCDSDRAARELAHAGLWRRVPSGFQVVGWEASQTLAEDLARQRASNRERQRKLRGKRSRASGVPNVAPPVTRDVTLPVAPLVAEDALGEEGKAGRKEGRQDGNRGEA